MILGSHNSMSYLSIKNKWFLPFRWISRCQNKTIFEQIDMGVELVDLRVALNKNFHWAFRHGMIEYDMSKEHQKYNGIINYASYTKEMDNYEIYNKYEDDLLYCLDLLQKKYPNKKLFIRLILERSRKGKEYFDKIEFELLCRQLEERYPGFTFLGGNYKPTWEKIYNFKNGIDYEKDLTQWVSSMQPNAIGIFRIWPWLYAKLFNKKNRRKLQSKYNMYDFIGTC